MKRLTFGAMALPVLVLLWAGTVPAAQRVSDDLSSPGIKPGRAAVGGEFVTAGSRGWQVRTAGDHLRYELSGGPYAEGTIEVAFTVGGREDRFESVGTLLAADNQALLSFYFLRRFNARGADESILWLSRERSGQDLSFGKYVSLGKVYQPGETVRLAFVWNVRRPDANAIYAAGKRAAMGTLGKQGRLLGTGLNAEYAGLLASTAAVQIGSDARKQNPLRSVLTRVAAHDRTLDVSELGGTAQVASVTDDSFMVAGISGRLVAGDTVTATLVAAPGGSASFDMGTVKGIPMAEVPATAGGAGTPAVDNGTYRGSYAIKPGDDFVDGSVVGHFVSSDNVAAEAVSSASKWTIDTKPVVTFAMDKKDLPADSTTRVRVKLVAKDANGNAVKGRHLKLTLATTDEYTGTVGAGDFGQNVGAEVETRWKGETDSWGEVEFEYKAGFAAKTVILTAKDLDSGGVSVDYVTAYKEASIDIALTAPMSRAAGRRGLQYILKVEASRTELTADGRSRSVIRATLLDPSGSAVANDPVVFALSSENGTLRTIKGTTDSSGVATAEYVAGKKIGIVVVTATAPLRGVSGSVSIILLSDAPAKIFLAARPQSLPADGFSRADLSVKVTDINDNPNKDTKVEFRIAKGGGKLDSPDRVTDQNGDAANRYVAGTAPGVASIVATVRSKVPSEVELSKARNVLFAPYSADGDSIRVERWLKKKGDALVKGETVLEYTIGRSATVRALRAPADGTLGDVFVEYWDNAEAGQSLATYAVAGQPGPGAIQMAPARIRRR